VKKHKKEDFEKQVRAGEQTSGGSPDQETNGDPKEPALGLIELKMKLEEKEREAKDNYDRYLRAVADLDNYKKRAARERADILKYGKEDVIKDLLPFLDSLDRALEHAVGTDVKAFKDGIVMIQEQLLCCLKKHGVEKIESAGADFDPNFHEALMQMDSKEHEDNKVVSEMQKGYLLNGRLLRPSRVCVCKKINNENIVCEKNEEKGE
jgi:molecular chaperone GrpE